MYISIHYISYSIPVKGSEGAVYQVSRSRSLYDSTTAQYKSHIYDYSCTCPDWQHRRRVQGGYCKHIEAVMLLPCEEGGPCLWRENENEGPWFADVNGQEFAFVPEVYNGKLIRAIKIEG